MIRVMNQALNRDGGAEARAIVGAHHVAMQDIQAGLVRVDPPGQRALHHPDGFGRRACGHDHLQQFQLDDLTTYDRDLAYLTGVPYAGVVAL